MTKTLLRYMTGVSVLILAGTVAHADVLFTTTGTTSGGSVSGTAKFVIGSSTMTLTLTNTTASVGDVGAVLDGLTFTLTGGSGLVLNSVSAAGFEDCHTGTCASASTFVDHQPPTDTVLTSPYDWGLAGTYSLKAGAGSYKPAGIVNSSLTGTNGIPSDPHNDYLLGPVVFSFDFDTAPTDVTAATFYWGTRPETTGSTRQVIIPTPEPGALVLLGTAVLSLGLGLRSRRQSA